MFAHRYQVVNGVEQVLYTLMPAGPAKALTVGMRLGNNFLGSVRKISWLDKQKHLLTCPLFLLTVLTD